MSDGGAHSGQGLCDLTFVYVDGEWMNVYFRETCVWERRCTLCQKLWWPSFNLHFSIDLHKYLGYLSDEPYHIEEIRAAFFTYFLKNKVGV